MRAPNEIEEAGILIVIGAVAIYYIGKKILEAFDIIGQNYVDTFYTADNQYGTNTPVTQGESRGGAKSGQTPDINTDPFIIGSSI